MGKYSALYDEAPPAKPASKYAALHEGDDSADSLTNMGVDASKLGARSRVFERDKPIDAGANDRAEVSVGESFGRGALQGATLSFGDEASAAIDQLTSKIPGLRDVAQKLHSDDLPAVNDPSVSYSERRDAYRAKNKAAEDAHKGAYIGGTVVGGLATVPLAPGAQGARAATTIAQFAKEGAKAGAFIGGVNGLGASEANLSRDGETEFGRAAVDTAIGAGVGAAAGAAVSGVVGGVTKRLTRNVEKETRDWITKDVVGDVRGASTATAKKNLARDAEDVADIVVKDRPLEESLRKAQYQDVEELQQAVSATRERLDKWRPKRAPLYEEADKHLDGGFRSGDLVEHLEAERKQLLKNPSAFDETKAAELQKMADRIKRSEDWGGGSKVFDPKVKIGDDTAGNLVETFTKAREGARTDAQKAALDEAIAGIREQASKPGYDPDKIVPTEKLRDLVTDTQKTAFEREGGLNGTERFNRAREVARVPEEFFESLKAKLPQDLQDQIGEHDRHVSAYLRIEQVLEQRLNHAQQEARGAFGKGPVEKAIHSVARGKHGIVKAAQEQAARKIVDSSRGLDRAARSLQESKSRSAAFARRVLEGINQGLTMPAAVEAAEAASRETADSQ